MLYEMDRKVPEHFYRNRLPHFDPKDRPYFVTYRLHGSIPKTKIDRLRELHRSSRGDEGGRLFFRALDEVLDVNGPYHLRVGSVRNIVQESLHFLEESNRIRLWAYCIMPNHVHAVIHHCEQDVPLYRLMQAHKAYTGRLANKALGRTGKFWTKESYDRALRDGREGNAIAYTIYNPVKAGFVKNWQDWAGTYLAPSIYGFE